MNLKKHQFFKCLFITFAALIFLSSFCYSQDFRNAKWGMNASEVERSEKEVGLRTDYEILKGETKILDYNAELTYFFIFSKLRVGFYLFMPETKDDHMESLSKYLELEKELRKKYGKASKVKNLETLIRLNNEPALTEAIMSREKIDISVTWYTPRTEITLTLYNTRNNKREKCLVSATYQDKEYFDKINEPRQRDRAEGL